MVLENFDNLLSKLGETEGKALPFSLLRPEATQPSRDLFGIEEQSPVQQQAPGTFDNIDEKELHAPDIGKSISKGIGKSIEAGINAIFDIDKKKADDGESITDKAKDFLNEGDDSSKGRRSQMTAQRPLPTLAAPPLQGGSIQLPQDQQQASGTDRLQQILDQQLQLRNQIRSRRQ